MEDRAVLQRVRNRVMDMLEWLVACEAEPPDEGMDELINSWEDWVPAPLPLGYFTAPVFTAEEEALLCRVSAAIDGFCGATPQSIQDPISAMALAQWKAVVGAAQSALTAMRVRGRMPETEWRN